MLQEAVFVDRWLVPRLTRVPLRFFGSVGESWSVDDESPYGDGSFAAAVTSSDTEVGRLGCFSAASALEQGLCSCRGEVEES